MANYTAADVKKLRELTGAGMMDCKKALDEADGSVDKAVEALRIKGQKGVAKREGRAASNGLVIAKLDGATKGTLLELNCETDFVAKNEQFQQLADDIVKLVDAIKPANMDSLLASNLPDGRTVAQAVEAVSAVIGEKLVVNRFAALDGTVATYMHRKSPDLPAQVGVLVEYSGGDPELARGVAMQIAAMRPKYVTRDEVPADVVENERRIAEQTAREEGKPEGALPKIVEGRVNGFFKDTALLEQPSVQDSKKTVKALLDAADMTVTRFARFEVGQA